MKKSFLLKFLVVGSTVIMFSTNANAWGSSSSDNARLLEYKVCNNINSFMNDLLYEDNTIDRFMSNKKTIMKGANKTTSLNSPTYAAAKTSIEKACEYSFSRVGLSVNTSINKRGSSYSYQPKDVCTNYAKYIKHIRSKSDNFKLKYFAFTNRITNEFIDVNGGYSMLNKIKESKKNTMRAIGYDLFSTLVNLTIIDNYNVDKVIHMTYDLGYQGVDRYLGFNDKRYLNFMRSVTSKDFYLADKTIEREIKDKYLDYLKSGFNSACKSSGYK